MLPNMLSIHERQPEVEIRFVILAKMPNATAEATLEALTMALNRIAASLRQTLTYDQGR
jgi:IS30 family transposase